MPEEKSPETALKEKLFSHGSALEDVLLKLEKVRTLLVTLENQYGWHDKPDLKAAADWMFGSSKDSKDKGEDLLGQRSCEWIQDYENIMTFLDIVDDYVYDSEQRIREEIATVK